MSGAVKTLNPFDHVKNTFNNIKEGNWTQAVLDPGDAFSVAEPEVPEAVEDTTMSESEKAVIAGEEAKRQAKKKKETTQTVLTSPLGATTTAKTAVTKLGGA